MALAINGQTQQLFSSLSSLGPRKLSALGLVGFLVIALVGLGSYYLSRPDMETLYSGLDRTDVTRIGAALTEAGISFDVSAKGDAILTPFSQTAPARMLLAEKGLPRSENAGYELFDNLGSIGLTSFMQEITRVRALEGEIARTIQTLRDVRAARVHIVLSDEGSFRREQRKPSASVVIRTDSSQDFGSAQAIRSLVASAIPGMTPGEVTVLNADGTLLASGDDAASAAPGKLLGIESVVSKSVEESIRRTLAPYLGIGNFQSSVSTSLNTDRRQVSERIFDPESRVERSTRSIRETAQSQDSTNQAPVGVEQDVRAADETATGTGEKSVDEKDRREELTNYEINEKTISTTSDGYEIERLSIAVVINRQRILEAIGENATDDQVDARIGEIESLVASASGFSSERGDQLKVTAVDFLDTGSALEPIPSPGFGEMFMRQSGTLINALTILAVAVLLIWFGLKPAIRAIVAIPPAKDENEVDPFDSPNTDLLNSLNFDVGAAPVSDDIAQMVGMDPAYLEDLTRNQATSPKARLEKLVDFDEEHAAQVLKQWIHQTQAA
ncbi:flagellar basal-body MS-ring/collar protein FliF [Aurantimonas sp. C2-6-R+9]|uniref:flagellar basal-body MS-ring/collar protein FliF n=1 Tax=unclassified Aurantimonas TaxID=2638230 RepID=UPI002E16DAC6|nr:MULTISPECIES: flagellar basal-body MS-ring/collar protein FliF [unclassified Aurantimonas]MEC5291018.1 flagellar basal-body MS-ring/collar protein FliF [Aurantimonas sp. C2-3-R2]MEC5381347.1 flagellar basal-body MS-ring/collar protein FliF [Aurantimonas sp. C2-6-R+9]MEC5412169.1 flagellar basal-body MS-ring/collar protein FliF [Aurantimonas sp. C2-4-R8]